MTSVIEIRRVTKSGPKTYVYDSINGMPIREYNAQRMREKRKAKREQQGLPEPLKRTDITPIMKERIHNLRNAKWHFSAIAKEVGTSEYIVKQVYYGK